MRNVSSTLKNFILQALLTTCISFAFASVTKCDAQSIVGKWKVASVKLFLNSGGVSEHPLRGTDLYEFEFKADHTYVITDGPGSKTTGTWSISGNQLTMTGAAEQGAGTKGKISTFSITGNKMIRTVIAEPPYNKMQSKSEEMSIRM
jgi:hypothetical protein